ncbi:MAG: TolC family protein [Deltaproteobacteria bacterium]|nr:TolC family protein [Deltaproteobacteria bacterium]
MSRMLSAVSALGRLCVIMGLGVILLSGCALIREKEDFYTYTTPPEKLREIETLKLNETKEEEVPRFKTDEQEPAELTISLEECRALTLENNLDLQVELINPTIAAERVSQEEAQFEAAFSASVNYSKSNSPVDPTRDVQGSSMEYISTNLGVSIPLRTGGTIEFDLTDNEIETNSFFSTFNPSYETDLSASISQPLLRNAGHRVNTYGIRVAEYNRQITDAQTKLAAIRVIADVDRAYWRLYATRRLLDVRKQQYELAQELFEQAERFVEVGVKPQIEVIRTHANVAEKLEDIIKAENDVRDTERDLKRMLNKAGLGMETETVLILSTKPDPVRYELNREEMVANAIENRMDLLELELQLAQDAITIDYRRNQTLPQVTMDYTYNINGLGPKRGDSYDLLKDNDYRDHRIGLQVSIPLGNKAAESRLRQAVYERTKRLAGRDNKKAQIKYEVLQQIDKLEACWQRILASRQATILQDQQYKAEKRQFELGLGTSTDVRDAQTKLADAQRVEILALTEYQMAVVDLAYATGTLLGAAKVQWEPIIPQD